MSHRRFTPAETCGPVSTAPAPATRAVLSLSEAIRDHQVFVRAAVGLWNQFERLDERDGRFAARCPRAGGCGRPGCRRWRPRPGSPAAALRATTAPWRRRSASRPGPRPGGRGESRVHSRPGRAGLAWKTPSVTSDDPILRLPSSVVNEWIRKYCSGEGRGVRGGAVLRLPSRAACGFPGGRAAPRPDATGV